MAVFVNFTLPKSIQPGDKIRMRGRIADGAEEYSINFANSLCDDPPDIAYQFKCLKVYDQIEQSNKQNGDWMDPVCEDNVALNGPEIGLEFVFSSDEVNVYTAGHNYITSYELEHSLDDIKSIQVFGDVDKITELSFLYN